MQITGWTWLDNPKYIAIHGALNLDKTPYTFEELRSAIISEIRNRGYKMSGYYHQGGSFGVPIIDDKYIVEFSFRGWGGIMADVLGIDDEDGLAYCDWAWEVPPGEEQIIPKFTDYPPKEN